jgi:hypothetical protein
MKQNCVVVLLFFALILTALVSPLVVQPAMAQAYGSQWPCADDMNKFCSGVSTGGGKLFDCYEQQKQNMSAQCVSWAENLKRTGGELRDACAKEIAARCSSQRSDSMELLDCLQGNYIDLSPKCVDKLNRYKSSYPKRVN